ncbi:MAG: ABC transporter permease [Thermoplasmata archaeon]
MKWHRRPGGHMRLQMALSVAAIAAAVALPVVLVSVGGGVSAHELAQIQQSGYEISVSAAGSHGITSAHGLSAEIDGLTDVAAASPILSVPIDAFAAGTTNATPVLAEGIVPAAFGPTLGPTEAGLFPLPLPLGDPTDLVHFDNGTYLGTATYDVLVATPFAAAAGVSVGEQIALGPSSARAGATLYNVTGTFGVNTAGIGPTGAFAVLLPLSDLQVMTGYARGGTNGSMLLDAADTIQVATVPSIATDPAAIQGVANEIGALVPYYGITTQLQQAQQLEAASAILTGFYLGLSSVGLTVGLIFLTIVLVRRVDTDRRSIGIRRAVGVSGRTIAGEMGMRGVFLAMAGTALGTLGGIAVVTSLADYSSGAVEEATSYATYDPLLLGGIAAAVIGLGAVASLFATRRALRLDLAEALR